MKTKNFLKMAFCSLLLASVCMSCKNDDNGSQTPKEQWGKTLKGYGEELKAYPDFFVNYWAYGYQAEEHQDIALCIRGQYPYSRYFSFSLYNDMNGDVSGGIDDVDIIPDEGSVNPYLVSSDKANYFTVYVVPPTMSEEQIAALPSKNICKINDDIKKACLCIRQYLGTDATGEEEDEYGGVELPAITAVNISTLEEMKAPDFIPSNVDKLEGFSTPLKSDEDKEMPFFLSPVSQYYPNYSTDYLYGRTHLQEDSVLTFSFIPASYPKQVEDFENVNTRYWSICLGSAVDTRSYYSIADYQANYVSGEKSSFIVVLKKDSKLEEVKSKVEELNDAGEHWNLFVWDSEKLNIDNDSIGEHIVFMYRNILPNKEWEYSIANMDPTDYYNEDTDPVDPIDKVKDPSKQIADVALGDYGPRGIKESTADFLKR